MYYSDIRNTPEFSKRFVEMRKAIHITRKEFADVLEAPYEVIRNIETGRKALIHPHMLNLLSELRLQTLSQEIIDRAKWINPNSMTYINMDWLINGNGEKFFNRDKSNISNLMNIQDYSQISRAFSLDLKNALDEFGNKIENMFTEYFEAIKKGM